jgi:hypothetical protein
MTLIRRISENGVVNSTLKILLCRKLLRSVEVSGDLANLEEARVLAHRVGATAGLDAVMVHEAS